LSQFVEVKVSSFGNLEGSFAFEKEKKNKKGSIRNRKR